MKLSDNIENLLDKFAEISEYIWQKSWAEKNAGNISVNITENVSFNLPESNLISTNNLNKIYSSLSNNTFLITAANTRMRDIAKSPKDNICLLQIDQSGKSFKCYSLSDKKNKLSPTSELPTHLSIHQMLIKTNSKEKVVVHTHLTEVIALTQSDKYCDEKRLNKLFLNINPEISSFIKKGIGFVPYLRPGSDELAEKTVEQLYYHDIIIWGKHGCISIGQNLDDAFDLIDVTAKLAKIYFMCSSAGLIS